MLATAFAVALISLPVAARPAPPVLRVNCDAGQSLASALKRAGSFPGTTIRIRGTCRGNFVLETHDVRLEGISPGVAALAAPAQPTGDAVLDVRDARGVALQGLEIRGGGIGVRFERSPGGSISDSEIHGNQLGVYFRQSLDGFVSNSSIHDNDVGLISEFHSTVGVVGTQFRDHRIEGAGAYNHGDLSLIDVRVTGSGARGVSAQAASALALSNTTIDDSGEVHAFASDRSVLKPFGVTLGSDSDSTPYALGLDDGSELQSGTNTVFHGDVLVSGGSYLELGDVLVDGVIRASQFSRVVLFRTDLAQPAVCSTGADLACEVGTTAASFDCPSAAGSCGAPLEPAARPGAGTHPSWPSSGSGPEAPRTVRHTSTIVPCRRSHSSARGGS